MSDFSELCPLFNTGVYNELTIPGLVNLTGISTTANILEAGADLTAGVSGGGITFGRTVVVTDAYVRRYAATSGASNTAAENLYLQHRSTKGAVATAFGTATVTTTLSVYSNYTYWAMTVSNATFTSNAVLSLGMGTVTATAIGCYDLIIRYKEA